MRGRGGGDGAIACSRQGDAEDDHDVHHSRVSAAQATLGLDAFDEEQALLDARDGEQPRLEIRVDRPSARKVAMCKARQWMSEFWLRTLRDNARVESARGFYVCGVYEQFERST